MERQMCLAFGREETPLERKRRRDRERQAKRRSEKKDEVLAYKREWLNRNRARVSVQKKNARARSIESYRLKEAARYERNKATIQQRARSYAAANRERVNEYRRAYYRDVQKNRPRKPLTEEQKQKQRRWSRAYYQANRKKCFSYNAEYQKRRKASDPSFAIAMLQRKRVWSALRRAHAQKSSSTMTLVGCTASELASHIEKQFEPGMSWDNRSQWHVDHILPLSKFDLTREDQQAVAFHYTNLRPMWGKENIAKGSKIPDIIPAELEHRAGSFLASCVGRGLAIRQEISCRSDHPSET